MGATQVRVLIELAMIDGEMAPAERTVVNAIADLHGLDEAAVEDMIKNREDTASDLEALTDDDKFEYMYSLVELMKIDGRMKEPEIKFISTLANRLGYDEAVLFELVTKVHADKSIEMDRAVLKKKVQSYLKK